MHAPQLVHFLDFNHNHRVVCVTIVSIVLKFYATISHNSRQVRGATAADSEPAAQALATPTPLARRVTGWGHPPAPGQTISGRSLTAPLTHTHVSPAPKADAAVDDFVADPETGYSSERRLNLEEAAKRRRL
jgi:hypothetical protein